MPSQPKRIALKKKIEMWGKRTDSGKSLSPILRCLCKTYSQRELAEKFNCSITAIRYWMEECSLLKTRASFEDRIKEMGYKDLKEFFTHPDNIQTKKSFRDLANETGFCYPTVSKWHKIFEDRFLKETTNA